MSSVFEKARERSTVDVFSRESIEAEFEDSLKNKPKRHPVKTAVRVTAVLLFGLVLGLFFMDIFVYPIQKTKAMRSIVYLNLYSNEADVKELADSPILSEREVESLLRKDGDYAKYYPGGTREAREHGQSALTYMEELEAMRKDEYDKLGTLNSIRYNLFARFGLYPPQYFSAFNPDVADIQPPLKPGEFFRLEKRNERLEYTGVGSGKN